MDFLQVSGISKQQDGFYFVDHVSFIQQKSQKIAIAGETGSGKSTLLKIIAGLDQADGGEVHFQGVRVKGLYEKLMPGQPGIAYLSQHYELRNKYRVEELLAYANVLTREESELLYEVCQIKHLMKRWTYQLSGGEKQRISLAILLTTAPTLLLLDEPFSNLDLVHKNVLKSVIEDISERLKTTCIITSHDPQDTLSWADEIMVMKQGKVIQHDTPDTIYRRPVNEYVGGLFGTCNIVAARDAAILGLQAANTGKNLFFRTEDVKPAEAGVEGAVRKISFQGSFYDLLIDVQGTMLKMRTMDNIVPVGGTIKVEVREERVWYL